MKMIEKKIEQRTERIQAREPKYAIALMNDQDGSIADTILYALEKTYMNKDDRIRTVQKCVYSGEIMTGFLIMFEDAIGSRIYRLSHDETIIELFLGIIDLYDFMDGVSTERKYFYKNAIGLARRVKTNEDISRAYELLAEQYMDEDISVKKTLIEELTLLYDNFDEMKKEMLALKNASFCIKFLKQYEKDNQKIDIYENAFKSYLRNFSIVDFK